MLHKLFIIVVATLFNLVAEAQSNELMKFQAETFKETIGKLSGTNMLTRYIQDWPVDGNDNECALIRVDLQNFPLDEASSLQFDVAGINGFVGKVDKDHLYTNSQLWVFITPGSAVQLKATHKTTGVSYGSAIISFPKAIEAKHVYNVTLALDRTTTINVNSKPSGAEVWLDGRNIGKTPLAHQAVPFGSHQLRLVLGRQTVENNVTVTDMNNVFTDFDLRERRSVSFDSDPSGAILEILESGQVVANGTTPCTLELPYGEFVGRATKSGGLKDEHSFSVNASTGAQHFYPDVRKQISFVGLWQGKEETSSMTILSKAGGWVQDELSRRNYTVTHTEQLPYGKYEVTMMPYGHSGSGKKTIKVGKNTPGLYSINMKPANKNVYFWEKEYNTAPFGVTFGYVQKQYVFTGYGDKIKYNGIGGANGQDKWLHGVQVGFRAQPTKSWGGGILTGLFCDMYFSGSGDNDYDLSYMQFDLYLPIHLLFRFPLSRNAAISINGGTGLTYAIVGKFKGGDTEDYNVTFGSDGWPKAFDMALEFGAGLRIGKFQLNFISSSGIINNKSLLSLLSYPDGMQCKTKKLTISLSWVIGG